MNKLALIMVILFTVFELIIGNVVICGMPLWLIGLICFSFIWIGIIYFKDNIEIKDYI